MSDAELDLIVQDARARRRRIRLVALFVVMGPVLVAVAVIAWRIHRDEVQQRAEDAARYMPHEDDARIRQTIAAVRARVLEIRAAWPRATSSEALAALAPGTAPCPLRLAPPTEKAARAYVQSNQLDTAGLGNLDFFVVALPGEPINDGLGGLLSSLKGTENDMNERGAWRSKVEELDAWNKSLGEYVFVVGHKTQALISGRAGSRTFTPGHLEGVAYVFSYDQRRVVCAAPISVSNSDQFDVVYQDKGGFDPGFVAALGALDRDLMVKAMSAIAGAARAVEDPPSH